MYLLLLITTIIFLFYFRKYVIFQKKFGYLTKTYPSVHWSLLKLLPKLTKIENGLYICNELAKQYPKYGLYCLYPVCRLIVYERNLAEIILNSNLDKAPEYKFHDVWLKGGLLTSEYQKWKGNKKLLAPAFNMNSLEHHVQVFNEKATILINKLDSELNEAIDILYHVNLCAFDMILSTAIGANIDVQNNPTSKYLQSIREICKIFYYRSFFCSLISINFKLTPWYRSEQRVGKELNDFAWKFIQERRAGITTSSTKTLLDILLENEDITDEEIKAQLNTFIFAGHDTTGITLSFALYALSKHPEIQEKVYQEIVDVIGLDNDPTYKDLMNLPYMSMMLMEVSRMYPAVPVIARFITKPIEWNGVVLPKELSTYVSIFHLHRDPEYFEDPDKFDPERFNEENKHKIPPFAYMPFSIGVRSCIGQKFAQLEMKVILANILRRYEILPASKSYEVHLTFSVTLGAKDGVKIRLRKR